MARRARAIRAVEAECAGLDFADARLAARASIARVEQPLLPSIARPSTFRLIDDRDDAFAVTGCQPHRFAQPGIDAVANDEPIDDRFDVVHFLRREFGNFVERVDRAIDPRPHEAGFLNRFDHIAMCALAPSHQRREEHHPRFGGRLRIVCSISASVCCAIGVPHFGHKHRADARHEQPQIIVDLGDRADSAPRVRRRRLLVDRDRGLQALDAIDVRPLHLLEELPRIKRQALHILPLPFGQQRVKRQRTFARSADARDHHEPIARNIDIHIVQIMRPRHRGQKWHRT